MIIKIVKGYLSAVHETVHNCPNFNSKTGCCLGYGSGECARCENHKRYLRDE